MKKIILTLSLVGFAAAPALAQMADFQSADADGDGLVTMTEAADVGYEWTPEQFAQADANGDGGLSEEEFTTATAG